MKRSPSTMKEILGSFQPRWPWPVAQWGAESQGSCVANAHYTNCKSRRRQIHRKSHQTHKNRDRRTLRSQRKAERPLKDTFWKPQRHWWNDWQTDRPTRQSPIPGSEFKFKWSCSRAKESIKILSEKTWGREGNHCNCCRQFGSAAKEAAHNCGH